VRVEDLAVAGGRPAFGEMLHVGRPNIGDRAAFLARVDEILDARWLTNDGPQVREFEADVAALTGAGHCVATANGTLALALAAAALGVSGEVILPAFTFVATAHALRWIGIDCVFADVEPERHTLDPDRVTSLITPRTSAIVATHLWGNAADVDALAAIAGQHGLRLLYDGAHALGCTAGGRPLGAHGDAVALSFHATKLCNALEGGAVLTGDSGVAERLKLLRNHGFAGYDHVVALGTNAKLDEVSAAMGITSLASIDAFVAANEANDRAYRVALDGIPGLRVLPRPEGERHTCHYVVLEVDGAVTGLDRDALLAVLLAENVLARRYFHPGCHRMEPYAGEHPGVASRLPVTERLCEQVLCLPTGTAVSPGDAVRIGEIIRVAIGAGDRVREALLRAGVAGRA
jgi:dTDP-4-amino-4,6-dideoxygalactose transaminase